MSSVRALWQGQEMTRPDLVSVGLQELGAVGMSTGADLRLVTSRILHVSNSALPLDPVINLDTTTFSSFACPILRPP